MGCLVVDARLLAVGKSLQERSVEMYLRVTRCTNKDASVVDYWQLAHNVRREGSPHPHGRVIHNFGRKDQIDPEALRRLAHSLRRREVGGADAELGVERSRPLGGAHGLQHLWEPLQERVSFRAAELLRLEVVVRSGPAGQVSQTSKLTPAQTQLLEALQVRSPVRVRAASASGKPQAA